MGRKIFISYKYWDDDVQALPNVNRSTYSHDYVEYIIKNILSKDNIYKGENNDEDISKWPENKIWNHLKDKIYDSTITIVLISPNMKEPRKWDRSQWIPWEIAYSLREVSRNGRTSSNNAILAVRLPDRYGRYDYYDENKLFNILKTNIISGYIYVDRWNDFMKYPDTDIDRAVYRHDNTPNDRIVKTI